MATTPSYPSISLGEALEKIRALYTEAHRRRMSREEIAKLLGYVGLNGASITTIANLARYGLLEGRGEQIHITEDAITAVIESEGSPDRAEALRRLAVQPELFAELAAETEGGSPASENIVRIRLERKGFPPKAAQAASRAFRETMELVSASTGAYNQPRVASDGSDPGGSMLQPAVSAEAVLPQRATTTSPTVLDPFAEGGLLLQVPFKGAALSVRIEVKGQALTKEHVARVRKYLELAEDDLDGGGLGTGESRGE